MQFSWTSLDPMPRPPYASTNAISPPVRATPVAFSSDRNGCGSHPDRTLGASFCDGAAFGFAHGPEGHSQPSRGGNNLGSDVGEPSYSWLNMPDTGPRCASAFGAFRPP